MFLGIYVAFDLISLLLLTPLFTLVFGWLVLASGQKALTDQDILFFVLTPKGLLLTLLGVSLYSTVKIFQLAAMISAGHYANLEPVIGLRLIGRFVLLKFLPLFRLALNMIARTALVAAPFLAIAALIFYSFLTEFDINFYLVDKPPVFWWAGTAILFCLLLMAGLLLRMFSGWVLALPLLLLNDESPMRALNKSRKASISLRFPIVASLLLLSLINAGLLAFISMLTNFAMDGLVAVAGDSLLMIAYLLGGLLVIWLAANVAIAFLISSVLGLFILSLFTRLIRVNGQGHGNLRPALTAAAPARLISATRLTALALLLSLAAGLVIIIMAGRQVHQDNTMLIAHRGASADAPENTLAALELAIKQGADWVEIDVQETRDGEIVVIHDSDLKKIGGSALKVFDASLAELQNVDIGSWKDPSFSDQRVPGLQQVLALCKDRINIVIELKYYGQEAHLEESVANLVEAAGMQDQIVLMSLSYPGIQKMKSIRPEWKVGLLSSVVIGDLTRLDVDFFAVNANLAGRAFIKRVHMRGRKVMVWTVNDPISMSAMMSKGVDGIITDKPALASKIRQERSELKTHERIMIQLASLIGRQPERPEQ